MSELVGRQLGNHRLLRKLGSGTFGEVYMGEHVHLKTFAAIKVLRDRLAGEEMEAFLSEARSIARLQYPHIVRPRLRCGSGHSNLRYGLCSQWYSSGPLSSRNTSSFRDDCLLCQADS